MTAQGAYQVVAVDEVVEVARETYRLSFRPQASTVDWQPGQFLMIKPAACDILLGRPMSIGDIRQGVVDLYLRRVGRGTERLVGMQAGEPLVVLGPLGRGYQVMADRTLHLLVAGGIGSAPFPLLARAIRRQSPESEIHFLYGEREKAFLVNFSFLDGLGVTVSTIVEEGNGGGQVTELLAPHLDGDPRRLAVYGCGPVGLLRALGRLLTHRPIPVQLSLEEYMACGLGACFGCPVRVRDGRESRYALICVEGPVFFSSELLWSAPS